MDGRVLGEALRDAAVPAMAPASESWEAAEDGYSQRLARTRLGGQVYLEYGERG